MPMNINDYETKYFSIYQAFAETVRFILDKALLAAENLPQPQSVQCRAKGIKSLRDRLEEEDKLDTQTLESDRRDLAGARLIFYTNNDVDRFLESRLIRENFEIEDDSTKIHHSIPENKGKRYRAIHYTVRLKKSRICLPEYARFAGLRCEIQVHTILNHAWSETSHGVYKNKLTAGYCRKAMKGIERRFDRIMDRYLIPAGFEIQKAQQEYERLLQVKELFDNDVVKLLDNTQNNNERHDILSGLLDYVPNYDDLPMAYGALKGPLLRAVKAARNTEPVPIQTPYGNWEGFTCDAVTKIVVEIVERLRYVDVVGTLQLLIDIYRDEPNDDIRQQIVNATKNLSEYNIDVYNRAGPKVQIALVDHLAGMSDVEVDSIRPIALTVWSEAIQSDITGTEWKADSAVLKKGAVPASNELREIRERAIDALFAAYDRSLDDTQKSEVLLALECATRTPSQVQYSNELKAATLKDATRIVDFVTQRALAESYELLQPLEFQFLQDYFRAESLAHDPDDRLGCQAEAAELVAAILKFRDTINTDKRYIRYKVLVGFESVFPGHWTEKEFHYERADEYRRREANRYIDEINAENENYWLDLIARCAETKSNDLSTFSIFVYFISKLAERKPEVADKFLAKDANDRHKFLAAVLNGLALSKRPDIYQRILESELQSARNLAVVAHHLRYSNIEKPDLAAHLLKRSIDEGDPVAVTECLLFALEHYGTEKIADADALLRDALTFLNDLKDFSWVSGAWLLQKATKFYEEVTAERTEQLLESLGHVPQVNYQIEGVLARLAERRPEAVWDYFGARLAREAADDDEGHFRAVPFKFHVLANELSKDPQLAICKGLSWFARDRGLFRFLGGHLLSIVFPGCPSEFAAALVELVKAGGDTEADFALEILRNYEGETSAHVVLKEIVSRFPDDTHKMDRVRVSIDRAGVVSGDFGLAEAWTAKKESLMEWLADERPMVQAFARKHITELDLIIALERRRAEADTEMRKLDYDRDDDDGN